MAIDIETPGANEAALAAAIRKLVDTTFSGAMVTKAANQVTADYTALTAVGWDEEVYDEGGWHDNATNNSRLTVPVGVFDGGTGFVQLNAAAYVQDFTGTSADLRFFKNGVQLDPTPISIFPLTNGGAQPMATLVAAAAEGDYFEAMLRSNGDASVTVAALASYFSILKLA